MSRIFRWFADNSILAIAWSVFAMFIIGYVVIQTFSDVSKITNAVVGALGVVFGLPTLVMTNWSDVLKARLPWRKRADVDDPGK